ncbi:hypothetical protein [Massilia sp. GCM10023247]|uniref:hypothetical protein n=1 Tax=Massilia sp. GCM10023247 TaxID=3252643 RepID=UPI00360C6427
MKHAKHSKPVRIAQIALALLVALAASTAAGQGQQRTQERTQASGQAAAPATAQQRVPPASGPSYGPVLHPQTTRSEPGAQPEQSPQAQEEKAGAQPPGRHDEVDPSARPAPQQAVPAKTDTRKPSKKQAARKPRRSVEQRIATVPEVLPSRPLPLAAPPPPQPVPAVAGPVQINSCLGGNCTDTAGGTYNTGVGNAAVNDAGRLCTRTGNTMQCF